MRLNAYVLAADPAWIEPSVLSYYDHVQTLVVSYDQSSCGWTGAPVQVAECLDRLRAIDRNSKMRFVPGSFFRSEHTPMENETYQRQCALDEASVGADWVLQIDTDEVLPAAATLLATLQTAESMGIAAVEWPMRVLYRHLPSGRYLEICGQGGGFRYEYPGPIAVRPGACLINARRAVGAFVRPVVVGDSKSLQITLPTAPGEVRVPLLDSRAAIVHNSWARRPAAVRSKISSWGHHAGLRIWLYYYIKWLPSPYTWRILRDFHPFARGLWPALRISDYGGDEMEGQAS